MQRNRNFRSENYEERRDRDSLAGSEGICDRDNELPRKRNKVDEAGSFAECCRDGIDRLFFVVDRLERVFKMKDGEGLHKFYTYIDKLSEIFSSIDKSEYDTLKNPLVNQENSKNLKIFAQELIEAGELNESQLLVFKKFGICQDTIQKKSDLSDTFESLSISSDSKVSEYDKITLNKDSVIIDRSTFISLLPPVLNFFDSSKGLNLIKLKSDSSQKKILLDKILT